MDFLVFLVSTNKHKFLELKKILSMNGINLQWKKMELFEPENTTLEKTAELKAEQAFKKLQVPLIVEDTGVFFSGYKNWPGSKAKREYMRLGLDGLINSAKGKKRSAYFKTVICYADNKGKKIFSGRLDGSISKQVYCKNRDVLPYEKIFIPKGFEKALCLLSRSEKNSFSHRAIAARKLAEWLKSH